MNIPHYLPLDRYAPAIAFAFRNRELLRSLAPMLNCETLLPYQRLLLSGKAYRAGTQSVLETLRDSHDRENESRR